MSMSANQAKKMVMYDVCGLCSWGGSREDGMGVELTAQVEVQVGVEVTWLL